MENIYSCTLSNKFVKLMLKLEIKYIKPNFDVYCALCIWPQRELHSWNTLPTVPTWSYAIFYYFEELESDYRET